MKEIQQLEEAKQILKSYAIPLLIGIVILAIGSYMNVNYMHLSEYAYSFVVLLPTIMLVSYLAERRRKRKK